MAVYGKTSHTVTKRTRKGTSSTTTWESVDPKGNKRYGVSTHSSETSGRGFQYGRLVRMEVFMFMAFIILFGPTILAWVGDRDGNSFQDDMTYIESVDGVVQFDETMWDDLADGTYVDNADAFGQFSYKTSVSTLTKSIDFMAETIVLFAREVPDFFGAVFEFTFGPIWRIVDGVWKVVT